MNPRHVPLVRPSKAGHGWSPLPAWLRGYRKADLVPDAIAGVVVATVLIPQAMAYALLAELPVEVGLYAALLPVAIYALLGSSRVLAVGPVALVSLLVATGIGPLAGGNVATAIRLAALLALMVGVIQLAMGLLRAGFLVNFLSHPVLSGFTSAAAIVIGASQFKHILAISPPRTQRPYELFGQLWEGLDVASLHAVAFGAGTIAVLVAFPPAVTWMLRRMRASVAAVTATARAGPLIAVILGTVVARVVHSEQVATVGETPAGLPAFALPEFVQLDLFHLLPTALIISLVGFMESFAVGQALASKRRQRVDADRELVALGVANLGSAATGGYPVTGGFSRSVVNYQAGARTGLASLISAAVVAGTLLFFTPLLASLPKAVLGAIIVVAVTSLVDFGKLAKLWRYSRADGICWLVTFIGVFLFGIEGGIAAGVVTSIVFFLWRTSQPHVAIVGQVGETEHYRNVLRHEVTTQPGVLAVRVDESLIFANVRWLEERLVEAISADPEIRDVLLICSGINFIDATGLEALESCSASLSGAGVRLNLAEVKGPVADRLERAGFLDRLGLENVFLSTHEAMGRLAAINGEMQPAAEVE